MTITISELTTQLTEEFKNYAKGCDLEKYTYYDELAEDFSHNYFRNRYEANVFLESLRTWKLLQLLDDMPKFYEDDSLVLDWVHDPLKLANAIVDYVVKNYVIVFWMNGMQDRTDEAFERVNMNFTNNDMED